MTASADGGSGWRPANQMAEISPIQKNQSMVPELDPSAAAAGVALMLGSAALFARRRRDTPGD